MVAQKAASNRRLRRRKLERLSDLREAVIAQLKAGWSPEQIAGRLAFEGQAIRVSHETIYTYVYGPEGRSIELARHLPSRRKKRRPRYDRRPRSHVTLAEPEVGFSLCNQAFTTGRTRSTTAASSAIGKEI